MKYDIVTKSIIKEIAYDISKYIIGIEVDKDLTLLEQEFDTVEKRESDILFQSGNNIIHIELQNANHKDMNFRMLRYYSDIVLKYQEYNIYQYVIYTGKYKCSMQENISRDRCQYSYKLIDMATLDCEEFLNSDNPASVALSVLCDFKGQDPSEVVNKIIQRLFFLTQNDSYAEGKYFKMLEVLSTNRDLEEQIKEGEKMFKVDIERLPSFQIGEERGLERGLEQGREQGRKENSKEIAKKLLVNNIDIAFIVDMTGLNIIEVEKLKEKSKPDEK